MSTFFLEIVISAFHWEWYTEPQRRNMKVLVIGAVAAGTKAAAKLKREDRAAEVKVITKGRDISYAGCGLPYYIGEIIENRDELIVNTPAKFSALTGVEVLTGAEATHVDFKTRTVTYSKDGNEGTESYDRLIIATGAENLIPPLSGVSLDGVFSLRTPDDAEAIRAYARKEGTRSCVIAGAGFIGLEVAENLRKEGLGVTVMDMAPSIMPNAFDTEMASWARKRMEEAVSWYEKAAAQGNSCAAYRLGKLYLEGKDVPKDVPKAVAYLTESAQQGNQYAQYALGKLYLTGQGVKQDRERAWAYFYESAEQGNEYADFFLEHFDQVRRPNVFLAATRLLHHLSQIFRDNSVPPAAPVGQRVDRKLRRKIQEKKIAMGHKPDDHEEAPRQDMGGMTMGW